MTLMAAALAVAITACDGDGDEAPGTTSPTDGATPAVTAEAVLTPLKLVPITATKTPGAPSEVTPTSQEAADAAFAAALENWDAVSDTDCETSNPENKLCVGLESQPSTTQRGIAVFGVGAPDGPGFAGVLGRDSAGEWKFWRAGQQDYQLLTLPGDALVCGYGAGLNVQSEPTNDAPAVVAVEDMTTVRAEEFLLTEVGSDDLQLNGYGWFRLSSPLDGWAYSKYLTNASQGDCSLHDALEPGP